MVYLVYNVRIAIDSSVGEPVLDLDAKETIENIVRDGDRLIICLGTFFVMTKARHSV